MHHTDFSPVAVLALGKPPHLWMEIFTHGKVDVINSSDPGFVLVFPSHLSAIPSQEGFGVGIMKCSVLAKEKVLPIFDSWGDCNQI